MAVALLICVPYRLTLDADGIRSGTLVFSGTIPADAVTSVGVERYAMRGTTRLPYPVLQRANGSSVRVRAAGLPRFRAYCLLDALHRQYGRSVDTANIDQSADTAATNHFAIESELINLYKFFRACMLGIVLFGLFGMFAGGFPEEARDWIPGAVLAAIGAAGFLFMHRELRKIPQTTIGINESEIWQQIPGRPSVLRWDEIADMRFSPAQSTATLRTADGRKTVVLENALRGFSDLCMLVADRVADRLAVRAFPERYGCTAWGYLKGLGYKMGVPVFAATFLLAWLSQVVPWPLLVGLWTCAVAGQLALAIDAVPKGITISSDAITLYFPLRVETIPAEAIQSVAWRPRSANVRQSVMPLPAITLGTRSHPIDLCHLGTSAFRLYCTLYVWWRQHQPAAVTLQAR
ncbi:MAG: hypothetical protein GC168_00915 [Candidatus Hydrogenedens sp.]|nr:hypothetical protein [Candidatus Hydrogenedens sp.]